MGFKFGNFEKDTISQITSDVKQRVQKNYKNLRSSIKPVIIDAIYDCPEMSSCRNGKLKIDFGLNFDPTMVIAWSVADSMRLSYSYPPNAIMTFAVEVKLGAYENLLKEDYAIIITEKGEKIPWLEWLLLYGNTIILYDFGVFYKGGTGRSGGGTMIENFGPFSVDPLYSGTQNNNFITRALNKVIGKIQQTAWQTLLTR